MARSSRPARRPSSSSRPVPTRSRRHSSSSRARPFVTRPSAPRIACARSRACGGDSGMSVVFILWLRELNKYLRSRAQTVASLGTPPTYLAVLQGLLMFGVTLVAWFRRTSVLAVSLASLIIALIVLVFAALATAIGSSLKDMQGFQMVMNFLVMPLWFLSGALYPLQGLPAALAVLTRIDPLTYGIDGVRGILIGTAHFGVALDIAVLLGVGVLFVIAGAWRFSKIEV